MNAVKQQNCCKEGLRFNVIIIAFLQLLMTVSFKVMTPHKG